MDRWVNGTPWVTRALTSTDEPVVVDLGFGSSPITTVELASRLTSIRSGIRVIGLEIDPDRVTSGQAWADPPKVEFRHGGFELAGVRQPALIRAFNVLRQYTEPEAEKATAEMRNRLAPGGLLIEGTCDEIGRRCCWLTIDSTGPLSCTFSCLPADLNRPSDLAARLPKALIHRNVDGERVHALLGELDACWAHAAPKAPFGPRVRWAETIRLVAERGWPVLDRHRRWRLGEVTVAWSAVAP